MGLLKHPKSSAYNNKNLNDPAKINIKNQLTPDDLRSGSRSHRNNVTPIPKRVTTPVNIRVDNHIRNEMSALIQLGFGQTNKDLVSDLVQRAVTRLDPERKQRFNYLTKILEEKDSLNYMAKHH